MSDTLNDITEHDRGAIGTIGAEEAAEGSAHGRHRGSTAPDDSPGSDPHGRHRR
ncbi:hypothetical protein AB0K43_17320 [Kitasatospora sp. NPDC049258]|uniref:hypothetical protein n=1 Tax=Kitasatospora sp. NPDC049258 TaxID=3155394 RepID=UPI00343A8AE2